MRRIEFARSIGALLVCAGSAWSAQEPPPLAPPALTPPTTDAPAVSTTPAAAPLPEYQPVLVVPGVTAPRSRPRTTATSPTTVNGLPALGGPNAPFAPDHLPSESPRLIPQPSAPPSRADLPLTLESVPNPNPNTTPTPARPTVKPPVTADPPPAASRRPTGLFGRLLPAPSFLNGRGAAEPPPSVTVEPRSDPAADAALKRRIERQIRESLGDKLRSVDVLVVDRNVTIRAKAARFWQRRGVRHTLETLPILTGSHARVEMID